MTNFSASSKPTLSSKQPGWIQALTTAFGILTLFSVMMIIITCNFWLTEKNDKTANPTEYYSEDILEYTNPSFTEIDEDSSKV